MAVAVLAAVVTFVVAFVVEVSPVAAVAADDDRIAAEMLAAAVAVAATCSFVRREREPVPVVGVSIVAAASVPAASPSIDSGEWG